MQIECDGVNTLYDSDAGNISAFMQKNIQTENYIVSIIKGIFVEKYDLFSAKISANSLPHIYVINHN